MLMLPFSTLLRPVRPSFIAAFAVIASAISYTTVVGQGLVYVDADDLFNLTPSAGGSLDNAMERLTGAVNGTDNKWRARVFAPGNSFGASGTVYESDNTEDSPEIKQNLTGLNSGTNYDVYAVWWSATNDNWVLRAGLSSNPGGNTLYDRTGAAGTPGQLAVFANWMTPPVDNLNIADGFTGIEASTLEGNRVMLLAKIGTAPAVGGQLNVFFDDAFNMAGAGRSWFDGVAYAPAGANVLGNVTATINRTTGALSINSGANFLINSIQVGSAAGALDAAAWKPVTGNLDSGKGFDDEAWQITSMTSGSLAENEVDGGGGTDGATVGPGGTATLNLGNVWQKSPFEDVTVNLRLNSSQFTVPVAVQYTGGTPIILGDFDTDGDVDVDDYRVVLRGLNQSQAGLTDFQSYALGDVNGDQQTNFADLVRFRQIYDNANGAGAFALLTGVQIPEPSSILLLLLGVVLMSGRRHRGMKTFATVAAVAIAGMSTVSPTAYAQITYIDAIATPGMSTAANGNPPINTMISPNSSPGSMIAAAGAEAVTLWRVRGLQGASAADGGTDTLNFANNGNAIQNGLNTTDNPGVLNLELVTRATGLNPGKVYNIYTFIWDDTVGGFWDIAARVGPSGGFTQFNQSTPGAFKVNAAFQAGPNAVTGINVLGQAADDFTDFVDGNREMFGMQVGLVSGVSDVDVYIRPSALSAAERTWYDGIGYSEVQDIPTLEVNTTTGEIRIKNEYNNPVSLSYYEIRSASGSLNPSGWNSLDKQNFDAVDGDDAGTIAGDSLLEGWDEAGPAGLDGDHDMSGRVDAADYVFWRKNVGTPSGYDTWRANFGATGSSGGGSSTILNETNLLHNSSLAPNSSISLGNAFKIGGTTDLTFSFGDVGAGSLGLSAVRYVSSGASAVATVPEPATLALLVGMGISTAAYRRRGVCRSSAATRSW